MIMGRDTGWFVKLYEDAESNLDYHGMSDNFSNILVSALKAVIGWLNSIAMPQNIVSFKCFK